MQESPTESPKQVDIDEVRVALIYESDQLRLRRPPYPGISELAANLREKGQNTPLFVRPQGGGYELISGYRRLAALGFINAPTALCRIYRNLSDSAAYDLAVSENQDRNNLTDLERADICLRLQQGGKTAEQIAQRMGWTDRRQVFRHLRLLKEGSPVLRASLQDRKITFSIAALLLEAKSADLGDGVEEELIQSIAESEMSLREVQGYLRRLRKSASSTVSDGARGAPPQPRIRELKNGAFSVNVLVEPRTIESLDEALESLEAALKRGRQLRRRLIEAPPTEGASPSQGDEARRRGP
jgi:ParB/RepB/Spo0J family partition protein